MKQFQYKFIYWLAILLIAFIIMLNILPYLSTIIEVNYTIFKIICYSIIILILDVSYTLFISKSQLKTLEYVLLSITYLILTIYGLFFKYSQHIYGSNLDIIPRYFSYPSNLEAFILFVNVIVFLPLGYFFNKLNYSFKFIFIIILSVAVEYIQYILHIGIFDLSDSLLYVLGYTIGYITYGFVKTKSSLYNTYSYDIKIIFISIISILTFIMIFNNIYLSL